MSKIILLKDRNNFFADEIFERLVRIADINFWFYDEFSSKNKKELFGKIFYLTPISDARLIDNLKDFIKRNKIKTINPFDLQIADKPTIDNMFLKLDIPHPKGILTNDCLLAQEFIKKHKIAIIKSVNDCGGSGHFIVRGELAYLGNKKLFLNFKEGVDGKREIVRDNLIVSPLFYIQKFLLPDDNCVWRAYIVGSEVRFFSVRKRDSYESLGDYVINAARGAKYYFPEDDSLVRKLCNDFAKAIGLQIGAIDFIFHQGTPYFLEVNCEGIWILICRKFYECSEYNPKRHNLDKFIFEFLFNLSKKA